MLFVRRPQRFKVDFIDQAWVPLVAWANIFYCLVVPPAWTDQLDLVRAACFSLPLSCATHWFHRSKIEPTYWT